MREQFEKLPEIAETLLDYKHEVVFHELENKYITPCYSTFVPEYVYFLNGAWYAFQEQQKRINEFVNIIHDAYMSVGNSSVEDVYGKIQDLLK